MAIDQNMFIKKEYVTSALLHIAASPSKYSITKLSDDIVDNGGYYLMDREFLTCRLHLITTIDLLLN